MSSIISVALGSNAFSFSFYRRWYSEKIIQDYSAKSCRQRQTCSTMVGWVLLLPKTPAGTMRRQSFSCFAGQTGVRLPGKQRCKKSQAWKTYGKMVIKAQFDYWFIKGQQSNAEPKWNLPFASADPGNLKFVHQRKICPCSNKAAIEVYGFMKIFNRRTALLKYRCEDLQKTLTFNRISRLTRQGSSNSFCIMLYLHSLDKNG